jgi:hypothetical protein
VSNIVTFFVPSQNIKEKIVLQEKIEMFIHKSYSWYCTPPIPKYKRKNRFLSQNIRKKKETNIYQFQDKFIHISCSLRSFLFVVLEKYICSFLFVLLAIFVIFCLLYPHSQFFLTKFVFFLNKICYIFFCGFIFLERKSVCKKVEMYWLIKIRIYA